MVEGGGLTLDVLDRCREEYSREEYAGERCVMGVDIGIKLHVVIRELSEQAREDPARPRRLWFAGIVDAFEDLEALMERFNVAGTVIDAQPEVHKVAEFARRHPLQVRVAWYGRQDSGFEWVSAQDGRPDGLRLNRLEALEHAFQRFHDRLAALPAEARQLGGRSRRGHGEYYRELRALQRTLEQDAQGNWRERWFDRARRGLLSVRRGARAAACGRHRGAASGTREPLAPPGQRFAAKRRRGLGLRQVERPLGMTKSPETAPSSQETSGGLAALSACVFPEVSLKSANLSAGLCS